MRLSKDGATTTFLGVNDTMSNEMTLGDFNILQARAKLALSTGKQVPDPFRGATTLGVYRHTVADARQLLPSRYQTRYVDVLEEVVNQAEQTLSSLHPRNGNGRRAVFEQLQEIFSNTAIPIVQLRSAKHQRELKAFLAVIGNVYRRFVNDSLVDKGARFNFISPDLDPLGYFGHNEAGPFTLPASQDMPVAIISKPTSEMRFLPFWAADGHEVGGHSIYGAVEEFHCELAAVLESNIRAAFRSKKIQTSAATVRLPGRGIFRFGKTVSMEEFMVLIWKAWLAEASADHAGLGNIGPMYLDSLLLLLSCLRPNSVLSSTDTFDSRLFEDSNGFEPHPIDIVRVLMCTEALKMMNFSQGAAYADALTQRLLSNRGGNLPETVTWNDSKGAQVLAISLSDFQAVLPTVVSTILTAKIKSLANNAFGDIVNWRNSDEATVNALAATIATSGTPSLLHLEPRHVVAASMLAMEEASLAPGFSSVASSIHNNGISILQEMYDSHCLLMSILKPSPGSNTTPTVDMFRLFKHVKARPFRHALR